MPPQVPQRKKSFTNLLPDSQKNPEALLKRAHEELSSLESKVPNEMDLTLRQKTVDEAKKLRALHTGLRHRYDTRHIAPDAIADKMLKDEITRNKKDAKRLHKNYSDSSEESRLEREKAGVGSDAEIAAARRQEEMRRISEERRAAQESIGIPPGWMKEGTLRKSSSHGHGDPNMPSQQRDYGNAGYPNPTTPYGWVVLNRAMTSDPVLKTPSSQQQLSHYLAGQSGPESPPRRRQSSQVPLRQDSTPAAPFSHAPAPPQGYGNQPRSHPYPNTSPLMPRPYPYAQLQPQSPPHAPSSPYGRNNHHGSVSSPTVNHPSHHPAPQPHASTQSFHQPLQNYPQSSYSPYAPPASGFPPQNQPQQGGQYQPGAYQNYPYQQSGNGEGYSRSHERRF
ncbi:hypothetical protein DFH06DRAFT_1206915 [Mycena polygramma]|nr:hypothetical protein DFH06DRAFT_1206915 [Mycena polygramma]